MNLKFKICEFRDISEVEDRSSNYFYLAYDKLILFMGKNPYYDPFIICEDLPKVPMVDMLYIKMNGDVKLYDEDNGFVDIATIEDLSQLELLKMVGTSFFIKADERYLDIQRRTLQLPYHNGTYSMSVSLAKDLKINNKTIVRYDQVREHWYIGGEYDEDINFEGYTGSDTNTVSIKVSDKNISADVRISKALGNIIEANEDGIFATADNAASFDQFNELKKKFDEYKEKTDEMMKTLDELTGGDLISEDTIYSLIVKAVSEYSEELNNVIDQFNDIENRLKEIEDNSKKYTDDTFEAHKEDMTNAVNNAFNSSIWGNF